MRTQIRKSEWTPAKDFLPLILGKEPTDDLSDKELAKLELFEKGLANELKKDDSIEGSITKIVKMALAAEFGPSLVKAAGAQKMVETITRAILHDPKLKKQALVIVDKFTHAKNSRR